MLARDTRKHFSTCFVYFDKDYQHYQIQTSRAEYRYDNVSVMIIKHYQIQRNIVNYKARVC